MMSSRRLSLQRRLVSITASTSILAIMLAVAGLAFYDFRVARDINLHDLEGLARITGDNSVATIRFEDQEAARDVLGSLQARENVTRAVLFLTDGRIFARFDRPGANPRPQDVILVSHEVIHGGEILGRLVIEADEWPLLMRAQEQALTGILFALGAAGVAILIAIRLNQAVARPIRDLAGAMKHVRESGEYSLRAHKTSSDEIGDLIDGFNAMLTEIERRDAELLLAKDELEHRVRQRTAELEAEVQERTRAEQALAAVNVDLEETARKEKELAEAAEAASRAKSEFLANMSHEIRTPLNGVIGMTGLLIESNLGREQRDYAETISHSAESLLRIINDILDFSKIEAGKMTIESIPFGIRDVVEECVEMFASTAHSKGLELNCYIEQGTSDALVGDPLRIRQILTNLISNAVKFTDEGEVTVHVWQSGETPSQASIEFTVIDTGIGIPADRKAAIFESFTQVDGSTTRRYGGTGLGLTICRQLVGLMNGTIDLESDFGRGTTFKVRLTLPKQSSVIAKEQDLSRLKGLNVLTVDDNNTNLRILSEQLAAWGCKVAQAHSGREALEVLAVENGHKFELVILDMQMPDMDGDQTAHAIRETLGLKDLPLVLLSSIGARLTDSELRKRGYSAALNKPARQSQLRRAILESLSPGADGAKKDEAAKTLAFPGVRILLAEDNLVNQRVAVQLLKKLGCIVDVAAHGKAALEALKENSYDVVLMDCQMPEMDGFEATSEIRRSGQPWQNIPIIAITAHAMTGDRELCLNCGMNDYLSKPVRTAELTEVLGRWVPESAKTYDQPDVFDKHFLVSSCALEPDAAMAVIEEFRESLPDVLTEIQLALNEERNRDLAALAHSLCGSARAVGAKRLAAACSKTEELAKQVADRRALGNAVRRLKVEAEQLLSQLNLPRAA